MIFDDPFQLGLRDLRAKHNEIKHQKQFEQRPIFDWNMSDRFQSQEAFFFLGDFIGGFFNEFHADWRPVIGDMVRLKHNQICIFDVEFDGSDVFDDQETLLLVELNDKLIFSHGLA